MSLPLVIGVGELLWDLFPDRRCPGGAPANFAFHANQLGCQGMAASRVGNDELGREIVTFLKGQGLDTGLVQTDSQFPTGQVTVDLSRPEHPAYTIHTDVAWDHLECNDAWRAAAKSAAAICFGTLAQRTPTSRLAIQQLLDASQAFKVFDINLRQHWYSRETIEQGLSRAQMVKLNHEEAEQLGPLLGFGELGLPALRDRLFSMYPLTILCVTRAERGCWISSRDESEIDIAGEPIQLVDPVGAGDAFTAAFISGLLAKKPLRSVAQWANRVGGYVASQPGAMPTIPAGILRSIGFQPVV